VIGKDEETDLAVLAVAADGIDLRPLELGDSDTVTPGDRVLAVGNPTGSGATAGSGRISAADRRIEAPGGYVIDGLFETDAVIEPASSGGPLIGTDGRVIGITARLEADTGFAVPVNVAREVLAQLEENHKVVRPYIGIRGRATASGVELLQVHPGGPAETAGLHSGDVVQSLAEVERRSVGDSVELRVVRDGEAVEVAVRLEERPATVPNG
jgi:S1-C subfamily serine protease